jgi:glycerol-3-phosphate acyltransferase PlsY
MDFNLLLAILLGYLLGSIPFAHIIATRVAGVDLAKVGSRNIGTRNLTRSLGLGWGLLGGALDFGKGALAMCVGCALAPAAYPWWMLAGTAAVAGHNWPVWLRFRGGKGLATAMGAAAFVLLWPELIIVVILGWLILHLTKNVLLMAAAGFAAMLLMLQLHHRPIELTWFVLSLAAAVLLGALPDILSKLHTRGGARSYFRDPNAAYKKKPARKRRK